MTTYLSLLRGINLGPARQLSMPQLKQLYVDLGLESVTTYIRSGNVVFCSADAPEPLRERIAAAIMGEFAMEVGVVLLTHDQLVDVVARNPFPDADPSHLSVMFMSSEVPADLVDRVGPVDLGVDEYVADGREVYLHLPHGIGRSKLATRMTSMRLPMVATMRNWRTVGKLVDLSS